MAPIRRYLRITKYSVLEVRIYLDNPALASSWLLNPRNSVLPRVIEAVRPLVLPKLREENARDRSKMKSKKKAVKDIVVDDDFEVSIFLTETNTRHSLLTKQKHFREKGMEGLRSNSDKLTGAGATSEEAIQVVDGGTDPGMPITLREDGDDDVVALKDIPLAEDDEEDSVFERMRSRPKRGRRGQLDGDEDVDGDGLFVESEYEGPLRKRVKEAALADKATQDDKKKMAIDTLYDGFSIYGRVLCLVVKRRDVGKPKGRISGGQAMMEEWITSTQMPPIDEDGP